MSTKTGANSNILHTHTPDCIAKVKKVDIFKIKSLKNIKNKIDNIKFV